VGNSRCIQAVVRPLVGCPAGVGGMGVKAQAPTPVGVRVGGPIGGHTSAAACDHHTLASIRPRIAHAAGFCLPSPPFDCDPSVSDSREARPVGSRAAKQGKVGARVVLLMLAGSRMLRGEVDLPGARQPQISLTAAMSLANRVSWTEFRGPKKRLNVVHRPFG
jgi:hypothetical protein